MSSLSEPGITVYTPDGACSSCLQTWASMIRELAGCRELIWRLLWRDVASRYRQSLLGYVWAIVPPVATAVMFTVLSRTRVLAIGETAIAYPAYVLLGMVLWQFFAGGVTAATHSLIRGEGLVT
ncbi:MAG: ABC transporter permease, partial [Planctomycetes bacterium]|nr:ABC transporter permease [Planctomycetota bacterium]